MIAQLAVTLHTLGVRFMDHAMTKARTRDDRGSVTLEQVVWAGAVVLIAGVAVAGITAAVKSGTLKIQVP